MCGFLLQRTYVANIETTIVNLKVEDKQVIKKKCEKILDNIKNKYFKSKSQNVIKNITSKPVVFQKADKSNTIVIFGQRRLQ